MAAVFSGYMSKTNLFIRHCPCQRTNSLRLISTAFVDRQNEHTSPMVPEKASLKIDSLKLKRGTGYRSSFSGLVVTVFGSTGFLAKPLVNNLARMGCQVICPYRGEIYAAKNLKLAGDLGQVLFVPFHLRNVDTLYRAMKYSNIVINLIGKSNETSNFDFESIHVEAPRTIARIAREIGVDRLIHVSALNSSKNPVPYYLKRGSKFLKTKYYGEEAVMEEFPNATIFRPADMYGEFDSYLNYYCFYQRRGLRKISVPNGGYGITKTPVHVNDVARGIVSAITDESTIGKKIDAVGLVIQSPS
ncbi:Elongation factor [Sarcoptes scabiei]|nr:Elongation factor [Sarcoptes scabiei]